MVLQVATGFFYQGGTIVLLIRSTMMHSIEPSVSLHKNVSWHVRIFVYLLYVCAAVREACRVTSVWLHSGVPVGL
jgi:hypothetical protein